MPLRTAIQWTDFSSNPIRFRRADGERVNWACVKVSPGCAHCYSATMAHRFGGEDYTAGEMAKLTPYLCEKELRALLTSKAISGKRVFVGDMTDIFGEWVSDEMLDRLFAAIYIRSDVTCQVLTKRADRAQKYFTARSYDQRPLSGQWFQWGRFYRGVPPEQGWPIRNLWLGVSAENQQAADARIPLLLQTPAAVRFVSAEPLIGPVSLSFAMRPPGPPDPPVTGPAWNRRMVEPRPWIDWVIVGGESGHGARDCDVAWVREIVKQCGWSGVPVFVKQLGSQPIIGRRAEGAFVPDYEYHFSDRKGGDPGEWAADLRVRQFPEDRS
ncbi:MAG: phage Gp37/Gp68 family protein [Acidobacteria bacterium]|nr:phage Gp37/Gp68 family protein [Acidobacteriota bacterium]